MNDRELIIELKEKLNRSIRNKDVAGTISVFADRSVMFVLAPPLRFETGVNAPGADGLEDWFSTFESQIELIFTHIEIVFDGNVAFTHCLENMKGKRTDGTYTDLWYRETLGLQKIDGQWKITHQHQSVPMYMDGTDRAATDLKP